MVIKKFVKDSGGCEAAAQVLRDAGFPCQQPKIHQVWSGKRPCSIYLAIEIEAATKGRVQALDLMADSLQYWRGEMGVKRYRKRKTHETA